MPSGWSTLSRETEALAARLGHRPSTLTAIDSDLDGDPPRRISCSRLGRPRRESCIWRTSRRPSDTLVANG
jgi:hypothetical protein